MITDNDDDDEDDGEMMEKMMIIALNIRRWDKDDGDDKYDIKNFDTNEWWKSCTQWRW